MVQEGETKKAQAAAEEAPDTAPDNATGDVKHATGDVKHAATDATPVKAKPTRSAVTTEPPMTLDNRPLIGRDIAKLDRVAMRMRRDILKMIYRAGSGHPGGSFSELEILLALYHGGVMRIDTSNPKSSERDFFILSKGHAAPGLYAVLSDIGFFPREEMWRLRRLEGLLQGHVDRKIPGIEMSSGSLGMGIGYANGIALASRLDGKDTRVYCMLGDGEVQEGQVWEAFMTSAHQNLDNLCMIIDHNQIQIDGFVEDVKGIAPLGDKLRAFNWHVIEIDGHDLDEVFNAFDEAANTKGRPTAIIANTVKGKGVSFMENKAEFHGRSPKPAEMDAAMSELDAVWDEEGRNWEPNHPEKEVRL